MPSVYVLSFILLFGDVGMSGEYLLSNVGESNSPCGTPVFIVADI